MQSISIGLEIQNKTCPTPPEIVECSIDYINQELINTPIPPMLKDRLGISPNPIYPIDRSIVSSGVGWVLL
jgi:hypothetical protein